MHPNEAPGEALDKKRLLEQAANPKVIAIGETGLDYYRQAGEKISAETHTFPKHIAIAKELKKPLMIHTRIGASRHIKDHA